MSRGSHVSRGSRGSNALNGAASLRVPVLSGENASHVGSMVSKVSSAFDREMEAGARRAELEAQAEIRKEISRKRRELEEVQKRKRREMEELQNRNRREMEDLQDMQRYELEELQDQEKIRGAEARRQYFAKVVAAEERLLNVNHGNGMDSNDIRQDLQSRSLDSGAKRLEEFSCNLDTDGAENSGKPLSRVNTCRSASKFETEQSHDFPAELLRSLELSNMRAGLPRTQIQTFKGDITLFRSWLRAFEHLVSSRTHDNEEKLHFLEQFTAGTPHEIVRGCGLLPADEGFPTAIKLLKKRYGKDQLIVGGYLEKILEWPHMKPEEVRRLDEFSVVLTNARNALRSLPPEHREFDNFKTLNQISAKLPHRIQERWRRRVDTMLEDENKVAKFDDLVGLVEREARILNNPLFAVKGTSSVRTRLNVVTLREDKESSRTEENKVKCFFCEGGHRLNECELFMKEEESARRSFVVENRLCFGCLAKGHGTRSCRNRKTCRICTSTHPTALHQSDRGSANHSPEANSDGNGSSNAHMYSQCLRTKNGNAKLSAVTVRIQAKNGNELVTNCFVDSGSSASFISEDVFRALHGTSGGGGYTLLTLKGANGVATSRSCIVDGLRVQDAKGESDYIELPPLYTMGKMPIDMEDCVNQADIDSWPYLSEVDVPDGRIPLGIVIGNNVPKATEPMQLIGSDRNGPYAVKTRIGWVIHGSPQYTEGILTCCLAKVDAYEALIAFYEKEYKGLHTVKKEQSIEDKTWLQKVAKSCQFVSGHYEIGLPFTELIHELGNNRSLAEHRLKSLKRKLRGNTKLLVDYSSFMGEMLSKGYAEEVPLSEGPEEGWFIPHHAVYQASKPDKVRVVYDCASKFRGISLNDTLGAGPDLTTPLCDVLLKFRQGTYAFMADIEAMFYQVKIPEKDRKYLRFLWWPNNDLEAEPRRYQAKVHIFGARSSPGCANFALRRLVDDFGSGYEPDILQSIQENFYVDDCLKSCDSLDALVRTAVNLKKICSQGGFNLTKWCSNSRILLKEFPLEELGKNLKGIDFKDGPLPIEKALGVTWDPETDRMRFQVSSEDTPTTRRGVLSVLSSLWDPLGMVAPFVLAGRKVLQSLCRMKIGWDEALPAEVAVSWNEWARELPSLSTISMDRCYRALGMGNIKEYQIHNFSDASETGYGCVSYLRMLSDDDEVHCSFVFGKARLNPIRGISVPRAELTAAALAVQVNEKLLNALALPIKSVHYWTDSTAVIRYIRNTNSRFQTYVANRLAIIHEGSDVNQWHYVKTSLNPADDASRGVQSERWLVGPDFLKCKETTWSSDSPVVDETDVSDLEVKRSTNMCAAYIKETPLLKFIASYSSLMKLLKGSAWLIRFRQRTLGGNPKGVIKLPELEAAERSMISHVQSCYFDEYSRVKTGKAIRKDSRLRKLDVFLDGGLLRVGGRLRNSIESFETRHPIVLPDKCHLTSLIVKEAHERLGHAGREHVRAYLRERFWILRGARCVAEVLRDCTSCRRLFAAPMEQKMSELPEDRLRMGDPVFTCTGLDCFGPFFVKRGRSQCKRYGLVFTCMALRAVHIEMLDSLDMSSFINGLRRFISRRGGVKRIKCDNGSNFRGAERELVLFMRESGSKGSEWATGNGIEWEFNPPYASHFGGIWERQIRTIRRIFEGLLKNRVLTDDLLNTLFCEVEAIVNSRPLSMISDDIGDATPLTPNHFLTLRPAGEFPSPGNEIFNCKRRWRQVQFLADLFWRRWRKEYLLQLQQRQRWFKEKRNLSVGDVVVVVDESAQRCHWPLAVVTAVKVSADGLVRSATVRSSSSLFERPISKLVMLVPRDSIGFEPSPVQKGEYKSVVAQSV